MINNHIEKESYKNICKVLIIIFGIMLMGVVIYIEPYISGDGKEYILQTEALANHFTMDIREEDFISLNKNYNKYIEYFQEGFNIPGLHTATNGKTYSAHYGGYSIFVLPVKLVLKLLDLNQLRSFQIVNAIFYIIALLTVYKFLKTSYKNKCILLILLMANPALYYITWTHTEIFSFSLMTLSLVYFYNKSYKRSIFYISLAAMQNPAIIMFGAIIGIDFLVNLYKKRKDSFLETKQGSKYTIYKFIKENIVDIIKTGILYFPFFLPIIQTFINFHKLNIVASVARESEYILEKAIGYFFDLNLGILPYTPVILILFFIFVLIGFYKRTYNTVLQLIGIIGIFYVICNQKQINSGMNGIMRYNVWIIPIMIFFIIMNKEAFLLKDKFINKILICSALITSYIFLVSGNFICSQFSAVQFSPWTKMIMNNIPEIYNPYHGIFITRTLNQESYSINYPVIYRDYDDYVRKILVTEDTAKQLNHMFINGSIEDISYLNKEVSEISGDSYKYINLNKKIKIKIYSFIEEFNVDSNINYSYLGGVYNNEGQFSWIKPHAVIPISDENNSGILNIKFLVSDLLRQYNLDKDICVSFKINDVLIKTIEINEFDKEYDINLDITQIPQMYNGGLVLEIITNAYFNPSDEGISSDDRDLSLNLIYVGFANKY